MGPVEEIQTFERVGLRGRRWYFRIVDAGNSEPLAQSQPYKTERQRDKTALRFSYALACPLLPERRR